MSIVKVGDQRIKFPDDMSQEAIQAALSQQFGKPEAPVAQSGIYAGLPQETVSAIKKRFPLGGRGSGAVPGLRKRAAELERLRIENPALAQMIEETGTGEAFLIGAGEGLTTIGRGIERLTGFQDEEEAARAAEERALFEPLKQQQPAAQVGKLVGESAPFLAAAPLTGAGLATTTTGRALIPAATTTAKRALGTGVLTGAEGATIAAGEGRTPGEIAATGVISGLTGGAFEVASPLARRVIDKVKSAEPSKKQLTKAISEAAPSIDELKRASGDLFDEVDQAGVRVSSEKVSGLASRLRKNLEDKGLDKVNTPKANRALERLEELLGTNPTIREIDRVRETAQAAASDVANKKESALGSQLIDSVDEFFDQVDIPDGNVGAKYREARDLWGRARRSELINEAIAGAEDQASGFENGIRIAFRQILKNKKQANRFSADEIAEMKKVVQGTKSANLAKLVGKMGISENQASNYLGAAIGAGGGAAIFGAPGAVIVPAIGQVSKGLAQKLTLKNARFADDVIRAGKNANKITAAYLKNTPKKERSAEELAQLLMRPKVSLDKLKTSDPVVKQATKMAENMRRLILVPAVAAPAIAAEENQ